mgnify:CR=1 FL=1
MQPLIPAVEEELRSAFASAILLRHFNSPLLLASDRVPWTVARSVTLPELVVYRLGIDIALIDALIGGDYQPQFFNEQLVSAQKRRRDHRVRSSERLRGQAAYEIRAKAQRDFDASLAQL